MTAVASPHVRQKVMVIASAITGQPSDAKAVVRNAFPLLAWLQDAPDQADMDLRLAALDLMWRSLAPDDGLGLALAAAADAGAEIPADTAPDFTDDAAAFVAGAEVFYLFAITEFDCTSADPDDFTDPAARPGQHRSPGRAVADAAEHPARRNAKSDDAPRRAGVSQGAGNCPRCGALLARDYDGRWWAPVGPAGGDDCAHVPPDESGDLDG